jgi:hypothetical protein
MLIAWFNASLHLFKQNPVFIAGIILILNMLGTKPIGLSLDKNKDMAQVVTAMDILKFAESR